MSEPSSWGALLACAVCFGAVDAPMTHGLNNGILALLGVIAAVQGGFVALFLTLRSRARRHHDHEQPSKVTPGGNDR